MDTRTRAVFDALLPSGAQPGLPGLFDAGFEAFHAEYMRQAPPSMRWALRAAQWAAVWLSPLLIGKIPPITLLLLDDRELALETMSTSRSYFLRQFVLLLKMVAGLCHGADPAVRRFIGFPGARP